MGVPSVIHDDRASPPTLQENFLIIAVPSPALRVQISTLRVPSSALRAKSLTLRVQSLTFRVQSLTFRAKSLMFQAPSPTLRAKSLTLRVQRGAIALLNANNQSLGAIALPPMPKRLDKNASL
ncbi:MAG: hypothetical protein KME43_09455 [Myxacorys chilensis ATA2-1-KO14]|nr:hypothetical protein [Myxacorys chilensis ATA2-1-KO14]